MVVAARVLLEKRSFSLSKEKPLFVAPLNVHQTEVYFHLYSSPEEREFVTVNSRQPFWTT